MDAGNLDHRITIQRVTSGAVNGFGEAAETWADLATLWASRKDVSDGEKIRAGQQASALSARFVIRSSTLGKTINTKDRISHGGAIWNIQGVKETDDGRNRFIEITAARESD